MCIVGADRFNISIVMSKHHAKILAEVLANLKNTDLMAICTVNNYTAHDVLGSTSGFVSCVGNGLATLQGVKDKQDLEDQESSSTVH